MRDVSQSVSSQASPRRVLALARWQAHALAATALLLMALLQRQVVAPLMTRLPADFNEETSFIAYSRLRTSLTTPWHERTVRASRVDQSLIATAGHTIVQASLHWISESGEPLFTAAGLYAVDRYDRTNLSGYGDVERHGQFYLPTHTPRASFEWWDPQFIQARHATFERDDVLDGLQVRVFRFAVQGIDESDGYDWLRDVPERYRGLSDAWGLAWVEPVSGKVVRYEEQGTSYFYDPVKHERLGDMHVWRDAFTPQSQAARIADARKMRLRILVAETYAPAALALAGLLMAIRAAYSWRHRAAIAAGQREAGPEGTSA